MPLPATGITYDFKIFAVLPGQNAMQVMQNSIPVFEKDGITGTTYNDNFFIRQHYIDFLSGENRGEKFFWTVRAMDGGGWALPFQINFGNTDTPPFVNNNTIGDFFDIFFDIPTNTTTTQPKSCGKHATFVELKYGPWREGKGSTSNIYVNWERNVYKVYRIIDCGLEKGHSGPHHGSSYLVYVLDHVEKSKQGGTTPPPTTPGDGSMGDEPPKKDQISKDDLQKILDNDKPAVGDGGGTAKVIGLVPKEPCPYQERKLLRTVVGSWKKGATEVKHIAYKKTVVAWATVTWTRDIYNVFLVKHCTLEKDHAGPHKLEAPGHEEWVKYGTITDNVTYGTGVPQTMPTDHWSDGKDIPHEDPPK